MPTKLIAVPILVWVINGQQAIHGFQVDNVMKMTNALSNIFAR
jgi:hypothetical protein